MNNWLFNPVKHTLWLPDEEAGLLGTDGIDWATDSLTLQRERQRQRFPSWQATSEPQNTAEPLKTKPNAKKRQSISSCNSHE